MLSYLPRGISTYAGDIDAVMWFIYVVVGVWFVLAELALFGFVFAGRRREGRRAAWLPADTATANAWVLVPVGLVFLCDVGIELYSDPVWHAVKIDVPETGDVEVKITGRQFVWLFDYPGDDGAFGTADDVRTTELHVPVDAVVRFELESQDVLHSFFVPELRLKQDAVPGRSIAGWFEATETGTFEIPCAELCGRGHTEMRGLLVVESREAFDAWLAEQR